MIELPLQVIAKPAVQTASGIAGTVASVGGMLGMINPWLSTVILIISILTALVGLYYKYITGKKDDDTKNIERQIAELRLKKLQAYKKYRDNNRIGRK